MKHNSLFIFVTFSVVQLLLACTNHPVETIKDSTSKEQQKMSASDSAMTAYKKAILLAVDEPDLAAGKQLAIRLICMKHKSSENDTGNWQREPGTYAYRICMNGQNQPVIVMKYNPGKYNPEMKINGEVQSQTIQLTQHRYAVLKNLVANDSLWVMSPGTSGLLNTSHEIWIVEYADNANKKYQLNIEKGVSNPLINQLTDSLMRYTAKEN